MKISYTPIGVVHSPFTSLKQMPIQPSCDHSTKGTIEVFDQYVKGLQDLDGFSHIILLYHLHKSRSFNLTVTPFLDSKPRGLFATRAPSRPNPIGISVLPLLRVDGNLLFVDKLDVLDGTPVLDIKPYVPEFDQQSEVRLGWLEHVKEKFQSQQSDDRFID